MKPTEFVFAYGSNMSLPQMQERCPNSKNILQPFVAKAERWKLCFPRHSDRRQGGVGSIVPAINEVVWGVVFGVTLEDLAGLDRSVGVPSSHRRDRVALTWDNRLSQDVWTYFAIPQDNPPKHYMPHQDYLALYIRGAEAFKLPAEYIDKLKKIETVKRRK
jgi:hypothetical protein